VNRRRGGPVIDDGTGRIWVTRLWRCPMLWTVFAILLILWLLGFGFHVGGGLIHLVLVIAAIVLIVNLLSGRRSVA